MNHDLVRALYAASVLREDTTEEEEDLLENTAEDALNFILKEIDKARQVYLIRVPDFATEEVEHTDFFTTTRVTKREVIQDVKVRYPSVFTATLVFKVPVLNMLMKSPWRRYMDLSKIHLIEKAVDEIVMSSTDEFQIGAFEGFLDDGVVSDLYSSRHIPVEVITTFSEEQEDGSYVSPGVGPSAVVDLIGDDPTIKITKGKKDPDNYVVQILVRLNVKISSPFD